MNYGFKIQKLIRVTPQHHNTYTPPMAHAPANEIVTKWHFGAGYTAHLGV